MPVLRTVPALPYRPARRGPGPRTPSAPVHRPCVRAPAVNCAFEARRRHARRFDFSQPKQDSCTCRIVDAAPAAFAGFGASVSPGPARAGPPYPVRAGSSASVRAPAADCALEARRRHARRLSGGSFFVRAGFPGPGFFGGLQRQRLLLPCVPWPSFFCA